MSGKNVATTFPTISENKNEPTVQSDAPKQKAFPLIFLYFVFYSFSMQGLNYTTIIIDILLNFQQGAEISVEEGTTSNNAKTITSSTHLELVSLLSSLLITFECKTCW